MDRINISAIYYVHIYCCNHCFYSCCFSAYVSISKTGFSIANVQIEESARDLGASEYQVFLHVTLPLAFPALLSGMILSFVRALGEFGATLMFAGNIPGKTQTIPTAIYMAIDASNMQLAWTLVVITISMSLLFLLCIQLINKRITNS